MYCLGEWRRIKVELAWHSIASRMAADQWTLIKLIRIAWHVESLGREISVTDWRYTFSSDQMKMCDSTLAVLANMNAKPPANCSSLWKWPWRSAQFFIKLVNASELWFNISLNKVSRFAACQSAGVRVTLGYFEPTLNNGVASLKRSLHVSHHLCQSCSERRILVQ